MTERHLFFISPKILQQLRNEAPVSSWHRDSWIADRAAQWGWDQREAEIQADTDAELEACCEWLSVASNHGLGWDLATILSGKLRAARRPKPPSLKEQAMRVLVENGTNLDGRMELDSTDIETIRRALEALPNE
jgi:hypothetical protein